MQSFIKKGVLPGSGLSSITENDETAVYSQIDLGQLTRNISQVTILLLLLSRFLTRKDFFLNCEIYINTFEHNKEYYENKLLMYPSSGLETRILISYRRLLCVSSALYLLSAFRVWY